MSLSLLALLMLIPLGFAAVIAAMPAERARMIALAGSLLNLVFAGIIAIMFGWGVSAQVQQEGSINWLPALGISLSFGADGVSMLLVLLTALLGPICVGCSWTAITERQKTFYGWLTVLQAAMMGVFIARDLILFYICFEFTLIPMYFLIALFGSSSSRRRTATKFFLYTFTGSIIALAGFVYVAWFNATAGFTASVNFNAARDAVASISSWPGSGTWTFDIETLSVAARQMSPTQQAWVLLALMLGFAVKVPLFPVHTWLPLAHTEAPTAGSVILAGVLLKLGTYGMYRFALPFAPAAFIEHSPIIALLCVIGILYGGLICWVQTDVKKLVAYSSVAHLGFCVLGLAALNHAGIKGSILYMLNHGLSTGALFLLIGMMYERYHTRSMKEIGGLASKMPVWATFMVFFTMSSVGLPGLNGFVSEFLCLLGAFQADQTWGSGAFGSTKGAGVLPGATAGELGPWLALLAGAGMIVAALYLLIMLGKVVWGPFKAPGAHGHGDAAGHDAHGDSHSHSHGGSHGGLPTDLSGREIGLLVPLAALCIAFGVYPKVLLDVIADPVDQTVRLVREARNEKMGGRPLGESGEAAEEPKAGEPPTGESGPVITPTALLAAGRDGELMNVGAKESNR